MTDSQVATVRFFDRRRLNVWVRGASEVVYDSPRQSAPYEAFVLYVLSDREHPITVEACGIYGQDTRGEYWRLSAGMPTEGVVVSRGTPHRWHMPFDAIAEHGLDPGRRTYAFARIAQPATDVWSRRMSAGPQRGNLVRPVPKAVARPAGQSPVSVPWWVRWLK
jgi:hypothetical protein